MSRARVLLASAVVLLTTACAASHAPSSPAPLRLTLWSHGGTPAERTALTEQVTAFEGKHPGTTVEVRVITEGGYNDAVETAIASDTLPDVLDVDGPLVASYAYQGALEPLDGLLRPAVRSRMLPSLVAQGTWRGTLWAVGAFDSGLAMWGDRAALVRAGVRIPRGPEDAWTAAETTRALKALAAHDPDGKVLDLRHDYGTGEWLTYGFSPLLSSAGAGLVGTSGRATGVLDSPGAVRALTDLQTWDAYADPNADGKAFTSRRVALSWVGHWVYQDYAAALGRDLVLLPLPDLGNGSKSGEGSWAWSVGHGSPHASAAAGLVDWLTDDSSVTSMTRANGAVPGTRTALESSSLVGAAGPLRLYAHQLQLTCASGPVTRACTTVPRPITPAYPTITAAFSTPVASVLSGSDPAKALHAAATRIDTDLAANRGYLPGADSHG